MQSKNYLIAIISIVLIVGIVLFISNQKLSFFSTDISGQVAKVTKTVSKNSAVTKTTSTKSTNTKTKISSAKTISTKTFCGDKTCVDGEHVSCYENTKGACECEKCIPQSSLEFQKSLIGKKSVVTKKIVVMPKLNLHAFIPICQTEKRYQTGAPIIDAFMMDFLANVDDKTLNDYANDLEMAYCNATNGEIVINITTKKYNWTNTTYPKNFTDYQPFMEEEWDETFEYYEEEYGESQTNMVRTLVYGDFLSEEDFPRFYYDWLYYYKADENMYYYEGFLSYANEIGYSTDNYDLLIILSGTHSEDSAGVYSRKAHVLYLNALNVYLNPYMNEYIYTAEQLDDDDGYANMINKAMHEIGHFTGAQHACDENTGSNCPWYFDLMSTHGPMGYGHYISFLGCSMEFFETYYIPNYSDGSEGLFYDYYSCE